MPTGGIIFLDILRIVLSFSIFFRGGGGSALPTGLLLPPLDTKQSFFVRMALGQGSRKGIRNTRESRSLDMATFLNSIVCILNLHRALRFFSQIRGTSIAMHHALSQIFCVVTTTA